MTDNQNPARRKRGGQPGNQNAKGHGAPLGNQNAAGHGAPKGNLNAVKDGRNVQRFDITKVPPGFAITYRDMLNYFDGDEVLTYRYMTGKVCIPLVSKVMDRSQYEHEPGPLEVFYLMWNNLRWLAETFGGKK